MKRIQLHLKELHEVAAEKNAEYFKNMSPTHSKKPY